MSPAEHLKELKNRTLICLVLLVLVFVLFYVNKDSIMSMALGIGTDAGFEFIYKAPQALFMQQIKLCIIMSLIVALPVFVYHALAFVLPAFDAKVRTVFIPAIVSYGLFLVGVYTSYRWFIPFIMSFLCNAGINLANVSSTVSVEDYLVFFTGLLMAVGIIFEIPLISALLCNIGILKSSTMRKGRKLVTVLALIVSAIITPPDVLSQIIVAFPILLLYELSIMLCKMIEIRKVRRNKL